MLKTACIMNVTLGWLLSFLSTFPAIHFFRVWKGVLNLPYQFNYRRFSAISLADHRSRLSGKKRVISQSTVQSQLSVKPHSNLFSVSRHRNTNSLRSWRTAKKAATTLAYDCTLLNLFFLL